MIPTTLDPMQRTVQKAVLEYIEKHQRIPSEMKRSLKRSEHVRKLIGNLTIQMKAASDLQLRRRGKRFKTKTIVDTVGDFTELFIKGFEGHVERRRESEMQKYIRNHADDDQKDMQKTLEGKSTGIFEDMGLVIPEDQQDQTENHIKEPIPEGRVISIGKG